ncbi:tail tape measure protein [Flavobacterium branchiophilum]|nr:tail tape measure protein [Flavobacterium branchiophilum] [Flavobacterium branchiophilum NBRC 15030 = ATCC 35035]
MQASKSATKANNALWKATQYVERTPWLKTTGKVVGKGAVVVGIAIDAFMIGSAYNEEGKFGNKTQQATGSAVGGAAGAWAGAELGAIIGTAICPGIGTVIGGVIGAIGGGLIGSGAGSALVDWMF